MACERKLYNELIKNEKKIVKKTKNKFFLDWLIYFFLKLYANFYAVKNLIDLIFLTLFYY